MSDATNSNIPNPGVPFLDQGGRISQVWWAFLLAIFQRTGGSGAGSGPVEDIFTSGTNFTPGTTATLTLSKVYTSRAAVLVHFDGTFQATDQYSVSGKTITFTSPIPEGVSKVYARG